MSRWKTKKCLLKCVPWWTFSVTECEGMIREIRRYSCDLKKRKLNQYCWNRVFIAREWWRIFSFHSFVSAKGSLRRIFVFLAQHFTCTKGRALKMPEVLFECFLTVHTTLSSLAERVERINHDCFIQGTEGKLSYFVSSLFNQKCGDSFDRITLVRSAFEAIVTYCAWRERMRMRTLWDLGNVSH